MTKAFHVLVSLMVALPLGAGGLCCCLVGELPSHAAHAVAIASPAKAATPVHSCCSVPAAAAESDTSDPARPDDAGEHKCGCPERETAVLAAAAGQEPLVGTMLTHGDVLLADSGDLVVLAPARPDPGRPDPPPKRPLFRTLSVLLC